MKNDSIIIRDNLKEQYRDIYTDEVLLALNTLAHFNKSVKNLMNERIKRRNDRHKNSKRIEF